ncbi:MAG TPA: type II secretion system F family protein [Gammaproteobacteria bacterium]|nr:type II secretion system F family protein [Gammaproteobacteria bacterium]
MTDGLVLFIAVVFTAVFLLSQTMIIPVFGESRKARKRLKKRLSELEQGTEAESFSSLLREKYLRNLSPWEKSLESLPAMQALSMMIEQAGFTILAYRVALIAVVLSVITSAATFVLTNHMLVTIMATAFAGALPFLVIMKARAKRILLLEEQLPEAIDMMKRALRAGHPFSGSLKLVSEEMSDPVGKEFKTTFADLNYGNDVRRAMLGMLQRIPSVPVMAFVTCVLVQKETGGNLAEILEQISAVIRGRFRLERKIKTLSAEGRLSVWVLAMVPLVLFAVIWITTPDYLPTLIENDIGQKLIVFGLVAAVIGSIWIRKIIRIDV